MRHCTSGFTALFVHKSIWSSSPGVFLRAGQLSSSVVQDNNNNNDDDVNNNNNDSNDDDDDDDDDDNDDNNNNSDDDDDGDDDRIEKRYLRFFTISTLRRQLFLTHTLKWPGLNRV